MEEKKRREEEEAEILRRQQSFDNLPPKQKTMKIVKKVTDELITKNSKKYINFINMGIVHERYSID